MAVELKPAYSYQKEIGELFGEYTQMLVETDPTFQQYLTIQNYDDELMHLEHKYGLPDGRLYIALEDGEEVMAIQISVLKIELGPDAKPLGRVVYGYGNDGRGGEGAVQGSVVFTNALGPVCVKNPRFAARLICQALAGRGVELSPAIAPELTQVEDMSFDLIRTFIHKKQAG